MKNYANHTFQLIFIALFSLSIVSCKPSPKKPQDAKDVEKQEDKSLNEKALKESKPTVVQSPKKIILFLGDGMGAGAVTAATYAKGKPLAMAQMPHFSWMSNHEYEYVTTDSAASATAFSTGHKTHFEAVSVKPGTTDETDDNPETHLRSVLKAAEEAGMKTGLVATSRINHATPAAFAANRYIRNAYEEIALDEANSGVDVMLGAGSVYFENRKDGKNLLNEMKEKGYAIAKTAEDVRKEGAQAGKLVGLMHEKDMPPVLSGERKMSLKEMTQIAIDVLDRDNDKGWFLLVEGSQIDWCEHDLAGLCTVAETLDFDDAIAYGREYVSKNDDALMVVTADHETAGVSVLQPSIYARYATILGGLSAAGRLSAPSEKLKLADLPEPIPAVMALNQSKIQTAGDPITPSAATSPGFGLTDIPDARFTVSFGYLSVASRHSQDADQYKHFSGAHTTTFVPLFAEGRGARAIASITDNAELGQMFVNMVDHPTVEAPPLPASDKPKNVILLIGDGMGINSVTAAYYGAGNLQMVEAPIKGIVSTNGTDFVVNDSAATATALATGHRTRRGSLGVVYKENTMLPVESILERAESKGIRTGLVTTTPLTHATPAAFYAHVKSRGETEKIADDFISLKDRIEGSDGVDIVIAGGSGDFFGKKGEALKEKGYNYLTEWDGKKELEDKSVVLLASNGLKTAVERKESGDPSLADMTKAAIDVLTKKGGDSSDKGFFLMVEGGQIDWLLHGHTNTSALVDEIVDFDEAVRAAVEFAKRDKNTLVLVTADHDHTMSVVDNHYAFKAKHNCLAAKECGGDFDMPKIPVAKSGIKFMEGFSDSKLQGDFAPPSFHFQYDWVVTSAKRKLPAVVAPHSANFVPLYAWGPGSLLFESFIEQPQLGKNIFETTGW